MKHLFLCLLVIGMILAGCSKNDDEDNSKNSGKLPDLPELPDPDDVCSAMNDINFMSYCYEKFDVNKDGRVSINEANAVKEINTTGLIIENLIGVERFPNLQILTYTGAGEIDLRYKYYKSLITKVDLSQCKKLASFCAESSKYLTTVIFSDDIETIDYPGAFRMCTSLSTIAFPKNLTSIDVDMFKGCTNLTNIQFPQKLQTIKGCTFYSHKLINLTFPESLTSIGNYAFEWWEIENIICYAAIPPAITDRSFKFYATKKLFVPQNSLQAYKDSDWGRFKDIQPIK